MKPTPVKIKPYFIINCAAYTNVDGCETNVELARNVNGTALENIAEAAKDGPFLSKDDFRERTKTSKTVIDLMADLGLFGDIPESNQLSLFDFGA